MKGSFGRSARNAPTPKGLELIEKDGMVPFHPEMYSNFNTVVLERYMDDRNRTTTQDHKGFSWVKLLLMVLLLGVPFAFITQYIALKTGIVISSLFYVAYLLGLALRWRPKEVNILSSATNLVDQTMVAFAFVFPVIFLLAMNSNYLLSDGTFLISESIARSPWLVPIVVLISTTAAVLALFHFVIYRKLWMVEEPLPTPGFESLVKLMDLSDSVQGGSNKAALSSMKKVGMFGAVTFAYAFAREFPLVKGISLLRKAYSLIGLDRFCPNPVVANDLYLPPSMVKETNIGISLITIFFTIGWYLRSRVALMILAGSVFMWLFLVPLSFYLHLPYYVPALDGYFDVNNVYELAGYFPSIYGTPSKNAFSICMNVGIGVVLGAGMVAFLKVIPSIRRTLKGRGASVIPREKASAHGGRYEWPSSRLPAASIISAAAIFIILVILGGFDPLSSLVMALFLTLAAFVLQAIAVKVAGETGSGPTVMMVCISLIFLFLVLRPLMGKDDGGKMALMVLMGTTAFMASEVIAVTVQWDYKTGLYIGTRPLDLMKAQIAAVIVGVPVCAICAALLAVPMAKEQIQFDAPWPKVYASLVMALAGGKFFYSLLLLGIFIGALIELLTGKGTVFGLGMFFSIGIPLMILVGGVTRDIWQKRLERKYGRDKDWEEKRTMKLLDSYMVMTGIFLGEALVGLLLMVYYLML